MYYYYYYYSAVFGAGVKMNSVGEGCTELKRELFLKYHRSCCQSLMISVYLQKAIKEKDIPVEGVEVMGPNREKADS
uniref:Uncharacterized protein n=2 Tax=Cyprinus carpio TaxID=7962 RepID=A0A8C1DBD9_CYPCA